MISTLNDVASSYLVALIFWGGFLYAMIDRKAKGWADRIAFAFLWPMFLGFTLATLANIWRNQQLEKEHDDGTL